MKVRVFSLLMVVCMASALFVQTDQPVHAQVATPADNTDLQVIESTSTGLVLELVIPKTQLEQKNSDRGPCQSLNISGWGLSGQAGEPALPIRGMLIGVPPGSNPRITILATGQAAVQKNVDLCPAPSLIQADALGEVSVVPGEELVVDPAAFAADQEFPGPLAQVGELSMIRSQQVAQVLLQPFRYNPATRQLTSYASLRVRVDFDPPAGMALANSIVDEGPYEGVLRSQVINYEAARAWRIQPETQTSVPTRPATPSCKISVRQDGMISVTYDALNVACPQIASQDPRYFHLYNQNTEVAIQVLGEADGTFNAGDAVLFYGQKTRTRYTDVNVYWLTVTLVPGLRMDMLDGTPESGTTPATYQSTVRIDENHIYSSTNSSGTDKNHWFWTNITSAAIKTYSISLNKLSISSATARLRGLLKGYAASPQHHVHISINGHLVLQDFWPARGEYSFDIEIPVSDLLEGVNTIQVECPHTDGITVNQVLVDWFEIEYPKNYTADGTQSLFSGDAAGTWNYRFSGLNGSTNLLWDLTDPLHPASITNAVFEPVGTTFTMVFQQTISAQHQYVTASMSGLLPPADVVMADDPQLRLPANGADYIMITYKDFSTAVQPLADFYTGRGLRVKVVDVQDIYDEFSGGVFTPDAIRDFLAYAYSNWAQPAPSFVLLIGDGNYDFMNYFGRNDPVFIPPFLADVDPWMGETDADNRFVTISGSDILPDMALGRWPVKTAADVTAIVNKTLSHYQHLANQWMNSATFVAGANDPSAGNFPVLSDTVINTYLPTSLAVGKVYYGLDGIDSGAIASQTLTDAVNAGRGLVHFIGHSNPYSWFGDINVPDSQGTIMLDIDTVPNLNNQDLYPVVISMTCYTGYFVIPGLLPLDGALVTTPNKGAVATWSPTGQGVASGHDLLDAGFFSAIYQNNVLSIGMAANQAKYYLYANSSLHRELIDTYILFGDPAMLYRSNPTSVALNYFQAAKTPGGVELSWETVSENTLGGFNLYRRELNGEFVKVNADLIPSQKGGQAEGSQYTYLDTGAQPGTVYEYRLDVIENSLQLLFNRTTLYWPYLIQLPLVEN